MRPELASEGASASGGLRLVWALAALKLVVHVALGGRYGIHRDEYYFIECGRHLAWGYVDHPPFVPFVARLSTELFGLNAYGLRLLPALAGAATVVLTGLIVRELGGGRFAQLFALGAVLTAPVFLRAATMLDIVVFEPVFWTLASWLVLRIILGRTSQKTWLLVGAVVGFGLLNKHTMLLWGAGLVVGLVVARRWEQFRTPWLWAGGGVAFLIFVPNLVWQSSNDWATLEFARKMSSGSLAHQPRSMFLLGQLLYPGLASVPLWLGGLYWLFRREQRQRGLHLFALAFLSVAAILFMTRAKPYYLAAAFPVVLAAGGLQAERWWVSARARVAAPLGLGLVAVPLAVLSLPIFPLPQVDSAFTALFGRIIPARALTHDLHDEYGWQHLADTVQKAVADLPAPEQRGLVIVTNNYGQAGATNALHPELPRAVSGHMSYHLWPPDPGRSGPLLTVGWTDARLARFCSRSELRAEADHPLARERHVPIHLCVPRRPLPEMWPGLRRYHHRMPPR